jgi:hypothetical protein
MQFRQAREQSEMSKAGTNVDNVFRCVVERAIDLGSSTGAYTTATISKTGPTAQDLEGVIKELQSQGYTVTDASTTITVSWQA